MKKIAILVFLLLSIPALVLFALEIIKFTPTIVILSFSIVGFLIIANYNSIEIKYKELSLKTYKKKIDKITEKAISDLNTEIIQIRHSMEIQTKKTKEDINEAINIAVTKAEQLPSKWG